MESYKILKGRRRVGDQKQRTRTKNKTVSIMVANSPTISIIT